MCALHGLVGIGLTIHMSWNISALCRSEMQIPEISLNRCSAMDIVCLNASVGSDRNHCGLLAATGEGGNH